MAATTNIGLVKPDGEDYGSVLDINANSDKIDADHGEPQGGQRDLHQPGGGAFGLVLYHKCGEHYPERDDQRDNDGLSQPGGILLRKVVSGACRSLWQGAILSARPYG